MKNDMSRKIALIILTLILIQGCISKKNNHIKLTGIAQNAKLGAILEMEDRIYYIDSLNYWDEYLVGKRIQVKGNLHLIKKEPLKTSEHGLTEQGFHKDTLIKVIKNAKYKIIE